jgi:hypothetical protein
MYIGGLLHVAASGIFVNLLAKRLLITAIMPNFAIH